MKKTHKMLLMIVNQKIDEKHRKKIEIAEKHLKLEQKKENKIFLGLVSNKRTLESGSDSNLV